MPDQSPSKAVPEINLASAALGARVLWCSDEFFAPAERMLNPAPPVFIADKYDDHGKWMDGWETRRRRDDGHDLALVALATGARLTRFDVETTHFTGNFPPACRIEACRSAAPPAADTTWTELLPTSPLAGNSHNLFACAPSDGDPGASWTHLRLHIYPDGGVARFRAFGQPVLDPAAAAGPIDLAAALNGGRVVGVSDAHYGDFTQILAPGRGRDMGDGWETSRRRSPGHDWIVVALGTRGRIREAIVDTAHYKGNFPHSCSLHAADLSGVRGELPAAILAASMYWRELLPQTLLQADREHRFDTAQLADLGPVTHARLNIFPDGGVSRLRLFGAVE